uniref:Uncharacterized protein n=1 Tax=Hyaloperonospora arabidopsidis (strain Emoy2) TaxID=559515 RepID=M4BL37_HYAAE
MPVSIWISSSIAQYPGHTLYLIKDFSALDLVTLILVHLRYNLRQIYNLYSLTGCVSINFLFLFVIKWGIFPFKKYIRGVETEPVVSAAPHRAAPPTGEST